MFKYLLALFLLYSNAINGQSDIERYEIYAEIISDKFQTPKNSIDSFVLIQNYHPFIEDAFRILKELGDNTLREYAIGSLHWQSYGNDIFFNRVKEDSALLQVLIEFPTVFSNHPLVNKEAIKLDGIHIRSITNRKFKSFFKWRKNKLDKVWKKIEKKYGTRNVIQFSKVHYRSSYAILLYEYHCHGLCGTGDLVILEKGDKGWKILSYLNLWMI